MACVPPSETVHSTVPSLFAVQSGCRIDDFAHHADEHGRADPEWGSAVATIRRVVSGIDETDGSATYEIADHAVRLCATRDGGAPLSDR